MNAISRRVPLFLCAIICSLAGHAECAAQTFAQEVRQKYRHLPHRSLDVFLALPCDTDTRRKAEALLGADAIYASVKLGNYCPLLDLSPSEAKEVVTEATRLFGGPFQGFWQALGSETHERLLSSPSMMRTTLRILKEIEQSDRQDEYKRFLSNHPDLLLFAYRYPRILSLDKERLPVVCHLLQHLHLNPEDDNWNKKLAAVVDSSLERIIRLYTQNGQFGPSAAILFLTYPELFPDITRGLNEYQFREDRQRWMVLYAQLPFIAGLRKDSLDWNTDRRLLSELLNRDGDDFGRDEWIDLLQQTHDDQGILLRTIWGARFGNPDAKHDEERLVKLATYMRNKQIPYPLLTQIVGAARTSSELDRLVSVCTDSVFESAKFQIPLGILAVVDYGRDDKFMLLFNPDPLKLVTYLYDTTGAGSTADERYEIARGKGNLSHYDFDTSTFKKGLEFIPGGSIATVMFKKAQGYPITKTEFLFAVVDAASFVVLAPGSAAGKVVGRGGVEGVEAGTKEVLRETLKDVLKVAGRKDVQQTVSMLVDDYAHLESKKQIAAAERKLLDKPRGNTNTLDGQVSWLSEKAKLPVRTSIHRSCTIQNIRFRLPDTFAGWGESVLNKDSGHHVLIVTLQDFR